MTRIPELLARAARSLTRALRNIHDRIGRIFAWDILGPTLIVVCTILAVGYADDRRSCERTRPTRQTLKRFVAYQAIFQQALSKIDEPGGPTVTITDPDTGAALALTRTGLRHWVQTKQSDLTANLQVPDCTTIPAGT